MNKKYYIIIVICIINTYTMLSYNQPIISLYPNIKTNYMIFENSMSYKDYDSIITVNDSSGILLNVEFCKLSDYDIDYILQRIENRENIYRIAFDECNTEELPPSFYKYNFRSLSVLEFYKCDFLKDLTVLQRNDYIFSHILQINLLLCKIKELPKGLDKIQNYIKLSIDDRFNTIENIDEELNKFTKKNNLISLTLIDDSLAYFPNSIFKLTNISELYFMSGKIITVPDSFNLLHNLNEIELHINNDDIYFNSLANHENNILITINRMYYITKDIYYKKFIKGNKK